MRGTKEAVTKLFFDLFHFASRFVLLFFLRLRISPERHACLLVKGQEETLLYNFPFSSSYDCLRGRICRFHFVFASVIKVDLIKDHKVEINYGPDKSVKHRPDKMARFEGVLGLLVRESGDDPSEIRIAFLSFYACASRQDQEETLLFDLLFFLLFSCYLLFSTKMTFLLSPGVQRTSQQVGFN